MSEFGTEHQNLAAANTQLRFSPEQVQAGFSQFFGDVATHYQSQPFSVRGGPNPAKPSRMTVGRFYSDGAEQHIISDSEAGTQTVKFYLPPRITDNQGRRVLLVDEQAPGKERTFDFRLLPTRGVEAAYRWSTGQPLRQVVQREESPLPADSPALDEATKALMEVGGAWTWFYKQPATPTEAVGTPNAVTGIPASISLSGILKRFFGRS